MKRFIALLIILAMGTFCISGCSSSPATTNWNSLGSSQEIKIAVLGSEEQFARYQDFFNGADMAIEELISSGVKISYEKIDDQGNYDNAINIATDISKDSNYTMAITVQDIDVVGPVVYLFNEAQKPIVIASNALSRVMSYGYAYVINSTLLAYEQGYLVGKAAMQNNVKWVAALHSESAFDKEFVNGFQLASNSTSTSILDIREITSSLSDLIEIGSIFAKLKPEALLIAHYDQAAFIGAFNYMRENLNPNITVYTNSGTIDYNIMNENKDILKNVIKISDYPINKSEKTSKYRSEYISKYGIAPTESACRAYDIFKCIVDKAQGTTSSFEFMNNLKSEEGYEGIATLRFDMYGRLITDRSYVFSIGNDGNIKFEDVTF